LIGGLEMGDECSSFIHPAYVSEYQELHKAICLNLNRMIWNIAFLKKAKEAQENGARCRNEFIIEHLYKNEFELLVLRLNRTFFDEGQDVITLSRLKDNLFAKYLLPEYKHSLIKSLQDIAWDSCEIVAARRRLKEVVPIFRNKYIAHTLMGEIDEVYVSRLDSEKVVMAACDLFNRLSYGVESFYLGKEKFYLNFADEKTSSEHFLEEFFLFQQTSAWCIKKLDCDCSLDEQMEIVKENIGKINLLF
jgi:hypothetical protein